MDIPSLTAKLQDAGKAANSHTAAGGRRLIGHNPVSIIVPCHRVIGSNGLTGYAGGFNKGLAEAGRR